MARKMRSRRTPKRHTREKHVVSLLGKRLDVTVTRISSAIREWIRTVLYINRSFSTKPLVVGVGVYWTPVRYDPDPPPEVLHLSVDDRCLIIQLAHCKSIPNILRSFFLDRAITFVGIWNGQDERKLATCSHRLEIWRLVDVRQYLDRSLWSCSVEKIVEECLGYEGVCVDKEISMSDWGVRNLSHDQILQASQDSYVSFLLYHACP